MQTYIDRLTNTGIPYSCAEEIVNEYWNDDDLEGLQRYINLIEQGFTICNYGGVKSV